MSDEKPQFNLTDAEHGMNAVAHFLLDQHTTMCATVGISTWDFCCALANVQGWLLARSKDMPESKAMERIDGLRDVARMAYREEKHGNKTPGSG